MHDFSDLTKPTKDSDNMGGISTRLYFCPHSEIAAFPKLPPLNAPGTASNKLSGSFSCKSGSYFRYIEVTIETPEGNYETVGEPDGRSIKHTLKFYVPGKSDAIEDFGRKAKNGEFVFLTKEMADADSQKYTIYGSEFLPMFNEKLNGGTGNVSGGRRGREFTFYSFASGEPPYLEITPEEMIALTKPAV